MSINLQGLKIINLEQSEWEQQQKKHGQPVNLLNASVDLMNEFKTITHDSIFILNLFYGFFFLYK